MLISGSIKDLENKDPKYTAGFRIKFIKGAPLEELKSFYDWFDENNCSALFDEKARMILFEKQSDAVLFRLTWG
jgi:hypothetical protein